MTEYLPVPDDEIVLDPDPILPSTDPEAPEADRWEQAQLVGGGLGLGRLSRDPEVPEADALEQATELGGLDDGFDFDDR